MDVAAFNPTRGHVEFGYFNTVVLVGVIFLVLWIGVQHEHSKVREIDATTSYDSNTGTPQWYDHYDS